MIKLAQTNLFQENQLKVLQRRGLKSLRDLLFYFPRRYIDRSKPLDLATTRVGDIVTFIGKVYSANTIYARRKRLTCVIHYENMAIDVVFFQGIPYYSRLLAVGIECVFSGKIELFRGKFSMTHPEIEIMTAEELVHTGKIIPLYKITEAMRKNYLTGRSLREKIHQLLTNYASKITDHLDESVKQRLGLIDLAEAFKQIHYPASIDDVTEAKNRLAFDELLVFSSLMKNKKIIREKIVKELPLLNQGREWQKRLADILPFTLTQDQQAAIRMINSLTEKTFPFAVLLQGDVGSGKTLVALMAALNYMQNDIQVAMMAPTEILARQHYRTVLSYLAEFPFVQAELVLGKEKAADKRAKLDRIQRGETLLTVGTHSLIQDDLQFKNLGFIIIDEQHRFGVEQREALRKKGLTPDFMAMTATPIPRSLTLTLYGDLETVLLKEKPPGRLPIDTRMFEDKDLKRVYKGIKKYVDQGRQAYIVYPIIDESDRVNWAAIMTDYERLESQDFKDYRLGLLHGRLSPEEKERAMEKFQEGTIQILVTTTVVEVGVDVANANVMMIRNAEKFGISQLHQLRGRVGRGKHQSFCILIRSENCTEEGILRLRAIVESEDGFYLAQKDLEIRGTGELLGLKQAGISEFKAADLRIHSKLAEEAIKLINADENLYQKITAQKNWHKKLENGLVLFSN